MFPRAELGSSMQLTRIDLNVIVHKHGLVRISMSQSHRRRTPACLPGRPPAPVKTSQEKVSVTAHATAKFTLTSTITGK